ncbi:MAG: MFS transporter [bacterium]|nr:MFS transporter [Deltaproteobacteria bacterium]MCP4906483.1 MFS transporter [bacterium]
MKNARYTLGLLLIIYVVNHIDRQVMSILAESIRIDLDLSDTQLGLLMGGGFAIFYTFAGIPIARFADKNNRSNIIATALVLWSAMTVASGLARNFAQLMAARIGVGVGEAGCTPPAHSIISDTFPPERRATALSTYQLGVPIGTLFGLIAGGYLAEGLGWQTAFFVVGVPGILLAVIAKLTLVEPERGHFDRDVTDEVESLGGTIAFMARLPSMRHVLMGSSAQTVFLFGVAAFHAVFLQRIHDLSISEAGLRLGLIAGIAGGVSVFGAGWLADRMGTRDLRWIWWIPAIGALLSLPFSFVAYSTENTSLAVGMIAAATFLNHSYSGLTHAIMQGLVKPRMRATMSAIALFVMNLLGGGLGPIAIGQLSDRFGLRSAMLLLSVFVAWASLHYLLGARTYTRDLEAKNA